LNLVEELSQADFPVKTLAWLERGLVLLEKEADYSGKLQASNKGKDFGVVIGTMADIGYSLAWRVLDAQYFGVPQRRRRIFIVGRRTGDGLSSAEVLFKSKSSRGNTTQVKSEQQKTSRSITGSI